VPSTEYPKFQTYGYSKNFPRFGLLDDGPILDKILQHTQGKLQLQRGGGKPQDKDLVGPTRLGIKVGVAAAPASNA
jgi:hypothetical protein